MIQGVGSVPLWLVGLLLFGLLIGACRLGIALSLSTRHDGRSEDEGYLLSATLALLGLLIAFTFSLALNRYDTRRMLLVDEANAIGTAWLRAGLIEGDAGPKLQSAITHYADIRLALPHAADEAEVASFEARTSKAQALLWQQMKTAIGATPGPIASTIVTATNEMFDSASSRKAERDAHIPGRVLLVLILYAAISAAIIGYVLGRSGRGHRTIIMSLFVLLTLALVVIIDLDRPWSGGITVSQQPMIDTRAMMR